MLVLLLRVLPDTPIIMNWMYVKEEEEAGEIKEESGKREREREARVTLRTVGLREVMF